MFTMNARVDTRKALKMLDGLAQNLQDKIASQAVNRTAKDAKAEAARQIFSEFNLPKGKINERIKLSPSRRTANVIRAEVSVPEAGGKYRALHITDLTGTKDLRFSSGRIGGTTLRMARRTRGGKVTSKGGVQYTMLRGKGKKILPNAFIAPGKNSGKLIAFQRINPNDRKSKLKAVYRIDVPQMFNTRRLRALLIPFIENKLAAEVVRLMRVELDRAR